MTKLGSAFSRRQACLALGGALAMLAVGGLEGCGTTGSTGTHTGYSDDTEYKDDPVTVRIIADERLQRAPAEYNGLGRVEAFFSEYQAQACRGEVTFMIKYLSSADLLQGMAGGLSDTCDGVVALKDTIDAGVDSGVLYAGRGGTSVRTLGSVLNETSVIVRATGSSVTMPPAKTLSGEDAVDGSITQIQSLPEFDGHIAIANDTFLEGVMANQVLARDGMYTEESGMGGQYSDSIKDKVHVYDSLDGVIDAVRDGACGIGFLTRSCLWGMAIGCESLYSPLHSRVTYSGASTTNASEGGVVRDFFEYLTRQV